jgi:UDP-N-acetylglucosamine 2-epimerase (non-hydrolysing)
MTHSKKTVLTVMGTRPEGIKMAPVIQELRRRSQEFDTVVCSTGQHREMLDQALAFFGIVPNIDLRLMTHDQTLAGLTSALFASLNRVVESLKPDWILAQGDTTTVLVAGIVAYYHQVKFGHVEAGLRTDDKFRPFPEELNRRVADQCSDLLFAPTEYSKKNLLREGLPEKNIHVTGNTVVDALQSIVNTPFDWDASPLKVLDRGRPYVLITAHRRESFGEPFRQLCTALKSLAADFAAEGVQFLYPVHLNPNVRGPVMEILSGVANLHLIEPLEYRPFVEAMAFSRLILTDSGGVQEEAPALRVPVLVMRETTERPEGVEAGVSKLIGVKAENIIRESTAVLRNEAIRRKMTSPTNPYGDGHAAGRIADLLT